MTRTVVTVDPAAPVKVAAAMLAAHGFSALPVVAEDDRLVGIVTEADVVRDQFPFDPRGLVFGQPLQVGTPPDTVGEVMTTPVCAMPPGTDIVDLARAMLEEHVRSIPIVEGSRVVGIVTRRDLVRVLARDDAAIAADVRHRLVIYGGFDRWTVRVDNGVVSVEDEFDDPADRHVVTVLALAVPGVRDVRMRTAELQGAG
ncbi:CBS domain-containing protein [Streptoalloteichus hindustanus]|uniref:CBS domain-containing protein n=2 Tax=Streptoalloteichus hindustanus TaxID=2017 RepID=A0A1M4Z1A5_STRHI|nr:CBS domain-containing protein [Streptoalloteichus hindustanus]